MPVESLAARYSEKRWLRYFVGIAAFVPFVGVFFSIIAFIWGLIARLWILAILGVWIPFYRGDQHGTTF